jgi:Xaa-Pro aminopeptidase
MKIKSLPKLIYACPETDADLLYATHFFAPDAFLFLEQNGQRTIVLSDLEVDRGKSEAEVEEIVALSAERQRLGIGKKAPVWQFIAAFLQSRRIRRAAVPASFPLGLARKLAKVNLMPQEGMLYPAREFKTAAELKLMRRALQITQTGMARGIEVLKASVIGPKATLKWAGKTLTSEILRAEIESAILRVDGVPANTIVAGGEQACDPHERGSGPLKAHTLIILDIFPRDAKTGYYGDLTRTVVRGKASDAQRQLWDLVKRGQTWACQQLKPGAQGEAIETGVKKLFKDAGFPTEQHGGRWRGMFHGLGHGLGLEIHEQLRISRTKLKPGQVLTIEPGLYWPGLGGVRHEDVIAMTGTSYEFLSRFPKQLEV